MGARDGRGTDETAPRLRAGLPVLWRSATSVQIGTDARWSVALEDLGPPAARALAALGPGADRRAVVTALRRAGSPEPEVSAVLGHLEAARLLVRASPAPGDETAWALLDADGDASGTAARRAAATVAVHGLGRTGTAVAALLATAGVGTVALVDPGTVTRHDVGVGGLRLEDVGLARTTAAARHLHGVAPGVRTGAVDGADLTVLVEHHAADPVRYTALQDQGAVHLSVVLREASVLVGPLVRPGVTACLGCLDLERSRLDACWPTLAAQLTRTPPVVEETTLAATSAALAAAQALAHLDGRPVATHDAALVVALPDAVPRRVAWDPQDACGCRAPVVTTAGG
ncbi:ThiF family adenylyltransferase [Actinotalea solisilvae]|uniref:ThiF family adenylyltransferase n=1 Tax=Actinotalea solisilvae TaxID=2072922 RepID=UPI0018F16282|nr:ThiF family adenylyltransferase [Actinotalea solisilvae]